MKFRDKEYVFTTDKITDIWCAINSQRALCENKEISVKVKAINEKARPSNFQARNKIIWACIKKVLMRIVVSIMKGTLL